MDLSIPLPPSTRLVLGGARHVIAHFSVQNAFRSLFATSLFFSIAFLLPSETVLGPKFLPYARSKSPWTIFQANNNKLQKSMFS